jgi:hypothetical protein
MTNQKDGMTSQKTSNDEEQTTTKSNAGVPPLRFAPVGMTISLRICVGGMTGSLCVRGAAAGKTAV